mmetsp:Transcript_133854/g.427783  ORF Transcript_133854/g.427783 Transcript_133854/m.427783 type:complete len:219 (-) Transcript_133854:2146-2802(-)
MNLHKTCGLRAPTKSFSAESVTAPISFKGFAARPSNQAEPSWLKAISKTPQLVRTLSVCQLPPTRAPDQFRPCCITGHSWLPSCTARARSKGPELNATAAKRPLSKPSDEKNSWKEGHMSPKPEHFSNTGDRVRLAFSCFDGGAGLCQWWLAGAADVSQSWAGGLVPGPAFLARGTAAAGKSRGHRRGRYGLGLPPRRGLLLGRGLGHNGVSPCSPSP